MHQFWLTLTKLLVQPKTDDQKEVAWPSGNTVLAAMRHHRFEEVQSPPSGNQVEDLRALDNLLGLVRSAFDQPASAPNRVGLARHGYYLDQLVKMIDEGWIPLLVERVETLEVGQDEDDFIERVACLFSEFIWQREATLRPYVLSMIERPRGRPIVLNALAFYGPPGEPLSDDLFENVVQSVVARMPDLSKGELCCLTTIAGLSGKELGEPIFGKLTKEVPADMEDVHEGIRFYTSAWVAESTPSNS